MRIMAASTKAVLHWHTGDRLMRRNRPRAALMQFTEAIRLERNFTYYISRGLAYLTLDDSRHAREDFLEAIRLNPEAEVAYYNLVQLYALVGEDEAARGLISQFKAMGRDPGELKRLFQSAKEIHAIS